MALVRAPKNGYKNYVILASFICNKFSMQMFHYWISNYNYAGSFLCRMLGLLCPVISSSSDFSSSWSRGFLSSLLEFSLTCTVWNMSKYEVFSGPYFPAFGLNTERYFVALCIQSECRKIRTRKNSVFGHFSRSVNARICDIYHSQQ